MANSVDPDQTAHIGAVCSGSTLFACILEFASNVRLLFAADFFSRQHFQMHFTWPFLGFKQENIVLFQCVFVFNVLPTAKVIWRRGHSLKSHPTDW